MSTPLAKTLYKMLAALANTTLRCYTKNKNTGNQYEIKVILFILRRMGLTNEMLDGLHPLFEGIRACNKKVVGYLNTTLENIRSVPCGSEFVLDGHRIVDLRNVTQEDGAGKTGDLIAISDSARELSISVCGGKCKTDGRVEKCLTNPSAKRVGANDDDITRIKGIQMQAVRDYKSMMTAQHGADENTWPSRKPTPVAVHAASSVALLMQDRFGGLPEETKISIIRDLLRIDDISVKPADYLFVADDDVLPKLYKFGEPVFTSWTPRIVADGIWLNIYNGEKMIAWIQVKFNNGVYHKGKTSSLCTSWNMTVNLRDVFQLTDVSS